MSQDSKDDLIELNTDDSRSEDEFGLNHDGDSAINLSTANILKKIAKLESDLKRLVDVKSQVIGFLETSDFKVSHCITIIKLL